METRLNDISLDIVLSYALKAISNSGRVEDYEDEEYREFYEVSDISLNDYECSFDEAILDLLNGDYNISVLVKRSIEERDNNWCVYSDENWVTLNKAESAALRTLLKEAF